MSKQLFRARIKYDTGCGYDDEKFLYILEDNSTDYRIIVDEKGEEPSVSGTDWYCNALSKAISLENCESCAVGDLPEKVIDRFNIKKNEFNPLSLLSVEETRCCFTCKHSFCMFRGMSKCFVEPSDSNDHYTFYCCQRYDRVDSKAIDERICVSMMEFLPKKIEKEGKTYVFKQKPANDPSIYGWWYAGYFCDDDTIPIVGNGKEEYYLISFFPSQKEALTNIAEKVSGYIKNESIKGE